MHYFSVNDTYRNIVLCTTSTTEFLRRNFGRVKIVKCTTDIANLNIQKTRKEHDS